jgi:8-oxo-dGTP pyrophosphatase MutT (NUDIX family)
MNKNAPGVYIQTPKFFHPNITSVACFIKLSEKILFLKKAPKRWSENLWGIPCGTVESNENITIGLARELQEEIGFELNKNKVNHLGKLFIIQNDFIHNVHHVFFIKIESNIQIILSDEHCDYKWLRKHELLDYDLIPNQHQVISLFNAYEI